MGCEAGGEDEVADAQARADQAAKVCQHFWAPGGGYVGSPGGGPGSPGVGGHVEAASAHDAAAALKVCGLLTD